MGSELPQGSAQEKASLESLFLHTLRGPHRRFWIGFLIFVLIFYVCAATSPGPGLAWDEAIYLGQAENYLYWAHTITSGGLPAKGDRLVDEERATEHVATLSGRGIQLYWQHESNGIVTPSGDAHPPLGKAIIAAFVGLFSGVGRLDAIFSARLAASCCFAAACVLLFLFMEKRFGLMPGVFSVVMLFLMPRVFGHSHIGSLEMPLLLAWVMTVIAFEKGIGSLRWAALTGVFFGLALLTRANAAMLPLILVPWGLIFWRAKAIPNIVSMIVLSPLVVFAGWPAFWFRTGAVVHGYILALTHRFPIPTLYFGFVHLSPAPNSALAGPWHYPFVLTAFTTPILILAAAILGAAWSLRRVRKLSKDDTALDKAPSVFLSLPDKRTVALLMFAALGPLCVTALPGAPKYDGVRLFLVAFPFLAALAGIGAAKAWEWLRAQRGTRFGRWLAPGMAGLILLWLLVPMALMNPSQLSYFNEFIGGPAGAQRAGMEITYWDDTFNDDALDEIAILLPRGGKVALGAIGEEIQQRYAETGRWPQKVTVTNFDRNDWDLLVVVPRAAWLITYDRKIWDYMNQHDPFWVKYLPFTRVPVLIIYRSADATPASAPPSNAPSR